MKDEEIIALAEQHGIPAFSTKRAIAFARAIADLQKEKDAKICEDTDEGFDGVQYHPATNWDCADAIRSPETDLDESLRRQ